MASDEPRKMTEAGAIKANFAGWKLDVLDAMAGDRALQSGDFRVAFVILQHLNSKTFVAYPSQQTIAAKAGMGERNVDKCLKRLKAAGWLRWERGNRQKSNTYSFDSQFVADAIANMKAEVERKRQKMVTDKASPELNHSSGQDDGLIGTTVQIATCTTVQTNTSFEPNAAKLDATTACEKWGADATPFEDHPSIPGSPVHPRSGDKIVRAGKIENMRKKRVA